MAAPEEIYLWPGRTKETNHNSPRLLWKGECLAPSPRPPNLTGSHEKLCLGQCSDPTHQVVLFVAHLGGVPAHAVHCQQQVQEGKRCVQPQQVIPDTREECLKPAQGCHYNSKSSLRDPFSKGSGALSGVIGTAYTCPANNLPDFNMAIGAGLAAFLRRAETQPSRRKGSATGKHLEDTSQVPQLSIPFPSTPTQNSG